LEEVNISAPFDVLTDDVDDGADTANSGWLRAW
ncbi:hypothetical protein BMETH_247611001717, partial [methanotrophic bacterial endosymbiont of Bathymodiolus sp.]